MGVNEKHIRLVRLSSLKNKDCRFTCIACTLVCTFLLVNFSSFFTLQATAAISMHLPAGKGRLVGLFYSPRIYSAYA
jgi:hypothetical protein